MTSKAKFEAAALKGFYPEVFLKKGIDTRLWYENYVKTYLERDIRDIYNISSLGDFRDFMKITAARTAQLYNLTAVSSASRTPATTVKRWLSILEATGIIFMMRPFHTNFSRRFTKMPKIFFYDTGLLCSLLGLRNMEQLAESAFFGSIFENYCVAETFKILGCRGRETDAYFLRTKKGLEADFVFEDSGRYLLAEFKTGKSMDSGILNTLRRAEEEIKPLKVYKSLLVNMADDAVPRQDGTGSAGANAFFRLVGEIK
jgi:predicted AAA+ superfamily ATPase